MCTGAKLRRGRLGRVRRQPRASPRGRALAPRRRDGNVSGHAGRGVARNASTLSLSLSLSDETFQVPTGRINGTVNGNGPLTAHLNVYVDSVDHRPCSATKSRSRSLALWPPASSSVALWRASVRCEEIVRSTVSRSFRPPPTTSPPPTSQTILHMSSGGRRGGRASVSTATTAETIRLGAPNGRPNSSRSISPATRRPLIDTVCCTW